MAIAIREARVEDAQAIARVHVDSWRTTYAGIVPDDYLARMSYQSRANFWDSMLRVVEERRQFVYVAETGEGEIVGFASGGPDRESNPPFQAELYTIYLLEAYQGQGLGRRLFFALIEGLAQAGLTSMLLWVFAVNPARRFYEALGGKLVKSEPFEIGGVTIEEVAYGWEDIRVLL